MKMSQVRYEQLKNGIRTIADHLGPQNCRDFAEDRNGCQLMWALYHKLTNQLQYNDNHPCFANGTWVRLVPHDENFQSYDDNGVTLHDTHIETALKLIRKELKLDAGSWK